MSTNEFRPLNENERGVILKAAQKGRIKENGIFTLPWDRFKVSYESMQGGFCICVIKFERSILEGGSLILRGASRRSYKDPRKHIKGEMIAFSRAVLYSRPIEV